MLRESELGSDGRLSKELTDYLGRLDAARAVSGVDEDIGNPLVLPEEAFANRLAGMVDETEGLLETRTSSEMRQLLKGTDSQLLLDGILTLVERGDIGTMEGLSRRGVREMQSVMPELLQATRRQYITDMLDEALLFMSRCEDRCWFRDTSLLEKADLKTQIQWAADENVGYSRTQLDKLVRYSCSRRASRKVKPLRRVLDRYQKLSDQHTGDNDFEPRRFLLIKAQREAGRIYGV